MKASECLDKVVGLYESGLRWHKMHPYRLKNGTHPIMIDRDEVCNVASACLLGGLDMVCLQVGDINLTVRAIAHISNIIKETSGFNWISEWNDAPERTKEDVITLLRRAADELREKGD